MKNFLFIIFLFFAIITNAQVYEEISYIPSASGNYDNLIVKGNSNIRELITAPFNIHSYSSILNVRVDPATTIINNLNVQGADASASFIFNAKEDMSANTADFVISGGKITFYKALSDDLNNSVKINGITFNNSSTAKIVFSTRDFRAIDKKSEVRTNSITIYGMDIPYCQNKHYWQTVHVGNTDYQILVCNQSNCTKPTPKGDQGTDRDEDYCWDVLHKNNPARYWDPTTCKCI